MPAAPIAPKYSWPSAPMLNRRMRNATAAASPVKASGVEAMSVLRERAVCEEARRRTAAAAS